MKILRIRTDRRTCASCMNPYHGERRSGPSSETSFQEMKSSWSMKKAGSREKRKPMKSGGLYQGLMSFRGIWMKPQQTHLAPSGMFNTGTWDDRIKTPISG